IPAGGVREANPGFYRTGPADAEARPIPAARLRPELPGDPDRAAHGEPGRGAGGRAGRDRRRRPAGAPAAVPAGPAAAGVPAAGAAAGADAGPDAGRGPAVPRFGDGRAQRRGRRPAAPAAAAADGGAAGGAAGRAVLAVAGALGPAHRGEDGRAGQPQPDRGRAGAGPLHLPARRRDRLHRRHERGWPHLAGRVPAARARGSDRRGHRQRWKPGVRRRSRPFPAACRRTPGGRSARRRPGLPPDALCGQRGGAARPGRGPRRGRPRHRLHPGPVRRRPPGRDCRAAWPPGPAAAGPGLCPADRAAGAQLAAAAALRPADAGLPGLPGGAQPDVHRRAHAGRGPPAGTGGPVVADPAAAGLRPVAVPARRAPAASAEGGGMRSLVRLHDLYIGRVVLASVLLTWAVLVGLDVVLALSGQLGDLGKGSYDFPTALAVVAYSVPRRAYTIFPYAAVIGSLLGLGQLAGTSELTALRALGLSRRRLSISVAAALVLLTALMVLTGETLAPWGQRQADQLKLAAKNNNVAMARYSGLWAR